MVDEVLEAYEDALAAGFREVREPAVPLWAQMRYSLGSRAVLARIQNLTERAD